jgi:hypothetical protein
MVASNRVTARLWQISHIGSSRIFKASVLAAATLLLSSQLALAQFTQQGQKLVGTGAVGGANQGQSVAVSGDGNTSLVGGPEDNSGTGGAWVYTRSNGEYALSSRASAPSCRRLRHHQRSCRVPDAAYKPSA